VEDHEGSLWVGTYSGGLNRLRDGSFTVFTTQEGLNNNATVTVCEDSREPGVIWVGTDGGVTRLNADGSATTLDKILPKTVVTSVLSDRRGTTWIGTSGDGVLGYAGGKIRYRLNTSNGLLNNYIRMLYEDSKGRLWIGSVGGVNCALNGSVLPVVINSSTGLENDEVFCMVEDRNGASGNDGTFYIGTSSGGVAQWREGAGVLKTWTTQQGLLNDVVTALNSDEDGTLWIGTIGGLHRLKNGHLAAVTAANGLYDNAAFAIVEDDNGNMWMSCNKGIYRASKAELNACADGKQARVHSVGYTTLDGLKSAECVGGGYPSAWKARDASLWFPTVKGLAKIQASMLRSNTLKPKVIIETMFIDGNIVAPDGTNPSPIAAPSLKLAPEPLSSNVERIEIQFTATSLFMAERVKFRFMLEGFDKHWVEAGTRRMAVYTNLPRGKLYRFRVQAMNPDGLWSEPEASVQFSLTPYVYETWWFYVCCVFVASTAVYGAYKTRTRILQARAAKLQQMVNEQTRELTRQRDILEDQAQEIEIVNNELAERNIILEQLNQEKNEFMGIAAHDLKSPLSSIMLTASIVRRHLEKLNPDDIHHRMQMIENTAKRMTDIITNLLDINALEAGKIVVNPERFNVYELVGEVVQDFAERAALKHITVHHQPSTEATALMIADKHLVREIVENLLSNAIKYSPHVKNIWVEMLDNEQGMLDNEIRQSEPLTRAMQNFVTVRVRDEGPGISAEDQQRLFQKFVRLSAKPTGGEHSTGLGLSIVKKLVDVLHGKVWCESTLGNGATFVVQLPKNT